LIGGLLTRGRPSPSSISPMFINQGPRSSAMYGDPTP
jgi:hypothetical protein